MANFSFGKFFGKSPRQPRFNPVPPEGARGGGAESNEAMPVGRLVSFTDHGPEDAPLFQELEAPPSASPMSPFAVVGGTRPSGSAGGLPGPARVSVEEGFTADELAAMVPAQCVRAGAVPANQVIALPLPVLRASLAAGQPAVLLSQLHQACPELFHAPSSLDQDLVIALPPQKVQRLVARADASGAAAGVPVTPPPPASADWAPIGRSDSGLSAAFDDIGLADLGGPPSKVKLPPPRRKFDELHGGDLRPLMDRGDTQATAGSGAFSQLGKVPTGDAASSVATPSFPSPFQKPATVAAAASPFQVTSALPHGQPPRGGMPKRFESPFAIVSAGEVPSVLESPFARHPVAGFDTPSEPPLGSVHDEEPPRTVSLRLSALLQGQNAGTLGFAPERVPNSVRVTLATTPLLMQVAAGRIRVRVEEVVAGLDAKFQPAFKGAQPGLELHVPLRELFDNLPEAAPPTPVAPPVASAFETPFSVRAEEDTSLTVANSPFQLAPPVPPAAPTPLAGLPPVLAESRPEDVVPPSPSIPLPAAPPPVLTQTHVERVQDPFIVIPEAPAPVPAAVFPLDEPAAPAVVSPFLLLPHDVAPSPPLPTPPMVAVGAPAPIAEPPASHASAPSAGEPLSSPPSPPLTAPPAQGPLPTPLRNPFALSPGDGIRAGLGLEHPMMPYDEDPVPLESLREEVPAYRMPPAAPAAPTAPPPVAPATASAEGALASGLPSTLPAAGEIVRAEVPLVARPPDPPALPPLLFVECPPETPEPREAPVENATNIANNANNALETPERRDTPVEPPVVAPPRPPRIALSEREPMPPPAEPPFEHAAQGLDVSAVVHSENLAPLFSIVSPDTVPSSEAVSAAAEAPVPPTPTPTPPASSPFLEVSAFQLPPLPFELLGKAPAAAPEPAPVASIASAPALPEEQPRVEDVPLMPPALAEAPPFTVAAPRPTEDERAAFASVFAPSALARTPDGTRPPLGEMDTVPAITLAKLPPIIEEPAPLPPVPAAFPAPVAAAAAPAEPISPPSPGFSFASPAPVEDLSFGYVDNPTQLALRAVFATDRTLDTQDVVDLAAKLEGMRACLVHTPHASLHSAPSPEDSEDIRHFRERAGALFEKTASLVRELDPSAREQNFTLRTGKSVVSFFAVDDICLAVLHAEPSFRPGVREKLTLVVRSVAEMLTA
jgi:hypothetical protein